ncbi:uncharacterized protein LOC133794959 isoform X2 [Humulus lupulus]|uniref:uncharacterized protein LOC133794959 isoform X2 n=1 Tax=Humulus lupulus TaxID=3486 RepID=UPI002B411CC5|nr:uncharacterized protein LOC133794959 isoform X2 [Humulus lupulus]
MWRHPSTTAVTPFHLSFYFSAPLTVALFSYSGINIQANPDSDQSISDEEDFSHDWPENCVSLAPSAEKKKGLEILSRLELLKGTHDSGTKPNTLSYVKPKSSSFEDDVEMPEFYDEDDFICPPKKAISEGINDLLGKGNNMLSKFSSTDGAETLSNDVILGIENEKQEGSYSWSALSKEGAKVKSKPKFSFGLQLNKDRLSSPCTLKDKNNLSNSIHGVPERLNQDELAAELPEDIQGEEENMSEIVPFEVEAVRHECSEETMADRLDGLQDNASLLRRNSKKFSSKRGNKFRLAIKRNISPLGDRIMNNEDFANLRSCSGSSSDSEISGKDLKLSIPQMKRQAMVDQFQEALGSTLLNDNMALHAGPKPPRSGLFWKLQQAMQSEKEQDMDFLKTLGNRVGQNEASCVYCKILARYLEGKLVVCRCFFSKNFKSLSLSETTLKEMADEGTERTVIFNPRVCNDVDLEVGNCIRIYPPWKEVQVGDDQNLILTNYFSTIWTSSGFSEEI